MRRLVRDRRSTGHLQGECTVVEHELIAAGRFLRIHTHLLGDRGDRVIAGRLQQVSVWSMRMLWNSLGGRSYCSEDGGSLLGVLEGNLAAAIDQAGHLEGLQPVSSRSNRLEPADSGV